MKVLGGVEALEPADQDVFLLCKQFMHSSALSQKPLLILPAERLSRLAPSGPGNVVPRNDLGERTIHEFRKTAKAVAKHPWSLTAASQYLEELCDRNESHQWPHPPVLQFINTPVEELSPLIDQRDQVGLPVELTDFAPGTPRKVEVGEVRANQRRNRGRGQGRGKGRAGKGKAKGEVELRGAEPHHGPAEGDEHIIDRPDEPMQPPAPDGPDLFEQAPPNRDEPPRKRPVCCFEY